MKALYHLLFIFLLMACTKRSDSGSKSFWDAFYRDSNYKETFERWTKRDQIFSNFDVNVIADVTYWNKELKEAYISAVEKDYRLSEEEARVLAEEQLAENESFDTFIISMKTRQNGWSKLGTDEPLWKLILENKSGNVQVHPKSIDKISYKDERARQYYLRMDRFSETYRVRFPKEYLREEEEIVLHLTGPLGALKFSFVRPQEGPKVP